jgi:ABC-type Mn2+/Zn2+ transport system permease subunit
MMFWSDGIMGRAVIDLVVVGLLSGVVGVHVLLRRMAFLTMSVAHVSFPGLVLAVWLGVSPTLGGLCVAWLFVALMAVAGADNSGDAPRADASTLVGIALAGALGAGALLQSLQRHPSRDLASLLTGSPLGVTREDIIATAALAVTVLAVVALLHDELIFTGFDPVGARAAGYGRTIPLVLELLVATTVVLIAPALGAILAPTLLIVPAMAARAWSDRIVPTMVMASGLGCGSALVGLWWSNSADVAAGPAVALTASGAFVVSWVLGPHGLRAVRTL